MSLPIAVDLVGIPNIVAPDEVLWPEGWPVPRVGDAVTLRSLLGYALVVRAVEWMPDGEDSENPDPVIYVAIGPATPTHE